MSELHWLIVTLVAWCLASLSVGLALARWFRWLRD